MKGNVQVSPDKWISSAGHSFVLDIDNIRQSSARRLVRRFAFNNLTRPCLDDNVAAVQVFQFPLE